MTLDIDGSRGPGLKGLKIDTDVSAKSSPKQAPGGAVPTGGNTTLTKNTLTINPNKPIPKLIPSASFDERPQYRADLRTLSRVPLSIKDCITYLDLQPTLHPRGTQTLEPRTTKKYDTELNGFTGEQRIRILTLRFFKTMEEMMKLILRPESVSITFDAEGAIDVEVHVRGPVVNTEFIPEILQHPRIRYLPGTLASDCVEETRG